MTRAEEIGVIVPEILLPDPSIDLQKWAVIACDQFETLLASTKNHSIEEIFIENGVKNA